MTYKFKVGDEVYWRKNTERVWKVRFVKSGDRYILESAIGYELIILGGEVLTLCNIKDVSDQYFAPARCEVCFKRTDEKGVPLHLNHIETSYEYYKALCDPCYLKEDSR